MSATPATGTSQEVRIDAWLETLQPLVQGHRARRAPGATGRVSRGHHILDARIPCAVEGGTDLGAASGAMGYPDAAPVHRRGRAVRPGSLA